MMKCIFIALMIFLVACKEKSNKDNIDSRINMNKDSEKSLTNQDTIEVVKFDNSKIIARISNKVNEIEDDIDSLKTDEYRDLDIYKEQGSSKYAIEGTQLYRLLVINMTTYSEFNKVVKIRVHFNGEHHDLYSDYYVENLKLIFNNKLLKVYQTSKWDDDYDSTSYKTISNQLFFENDSLIKWDKDNSYDNKLYFKFTDIEKDVLTDFKLYLDITNANNSNRCTTP